MEEIPQDKKGIMNKSGLYLLDVKQLVLNQLVNYFHLSRAIVGANELFDCSMDQNRILFFSSLTRVRLMSMPHRNTVKFMGMR